MPLPTTSALLPLSGDTHVRTHTHVHSHIYTLLRPKAISLPLLLPVRKNFVTGNILKRQTGSLGRVCPLCHQSLLEPNRHRAREIPEQEG